ncbi:IS1182 family transposase [Salsuginibacillus kocurii]|uniref:IS1182 family transposase n=1 Tax=Salsuginibacillus kocurii TaxID=427078 RepID=UPI0003600B86|nr:IS1182 family transposase [Salsuginibacillus kocurii]
MFKDYTMGQLVLPMDFSDLIPENHVSRVVHDMIEQVDEQLFYAAYEGGGRPSYHPKMMTKIVLYAYTQKWYSCRDIQKALEENLPMMWLAAQQVPNFRTINRFRSERMQDLIEPLFTQLIQLLLDQEYITMEHYFLDGTKIEANANRYSFVWRKASERYEAKLQDKLKTLFAHIEDTIRQDEATCSPSEEPSARITSEQLQEAVHQVEEQLGKAEQAVESAADPEEKKVKKEELRTLRRMHKSMTSDYLPRLQKYEDHFATFGDRNSFSKTDRDATFMRMKEDHMKNGQLKPGYNVQAGTENQFILGYSIHQRPTDARCFQPHMKMLKNRALPFPEQVVADAGYGNESNYVYADDQDIDLLVPYNMWRKEKKRSFKKNPYHVQNWTYDDKGDYFICPNNQKVTFRYKKHRTDTYGYRRQFRIYEAEDCSNCPVKSACTKAKGNRQIHYNPLYEAKKKKAREALGTEEGAETYKLRKVEVESVFGHIKGNRSLRRFSLRGLDKVNVEFGLAAIAHNLLKQKEVDNLYHYHKDNTKKSVVMNNHHNGFFNTFQRLLGQPLCLSIKHVELYRL